jgi:hypothetical protein
VHGPHRHLDGKGEEKGEEDQDLRRQPDRHLVHVQHGERAGLGVQVEERDQHQHRTEERVEKELDGRVDALRPAPHADDDEHRDEQRLPEDIEQHRVQRCERPDHQPLEDQECSHVLRGAILDDLPARDHHQDRGERRQQHQGHRDAVDADVIVDAEDLDPRHTLDELHLVGGHVEADVERNRQSQREQRDDQRQRPRRRTARVGPRHQDAQPANDGGPDDEAQDWDVEHRERAYLESAGRVTNRPMRSSRPRIIANA